MPDPGTNEEMKLMDDASKLARGFMVGLALLALLGFFGGLFWLCTGPEPMHVSP